MLDKIFSLTKKIRPIKSRHNLDKKSIQKTFGPIKQLIDKTFIPIINIDKKNLNLKVATKNARQKN